MDSIHSPVEHGENAKVANMNTGKAIFFGLALITLAIFARDLVPSITALSSEVGRYAIANVGEQNFYYEMDIATGAVQMCRYDKKPLDIFGDPCS